MFLITDVLAKLMILKVNISDARGVLERRWVVTAVLIETGRELFEFHHVLSKRTCFVTEDVVDHP